MKERILLNIKEVSEKLDIKVSTVYAWVNQRKIPYVKVGRLLKFDLSDIEAWISERKFKVQEYSGKRLQ